MVFRWEDFSEGHALLGVALSLVSSLLLFLTSFSTPYIKGIYWLSLRDGTTFGTFGYCNPPNTVSNLTIGSIPGGGCTPSMVGYDVGPEVISWMTKTHVLFPTAAVLMLLALITLVLSFLKVGKFMWNPVYFRTCALLGTAFAIIAEVFALVCWVGARQTYNNEDKGGKYGAGLWLGLVGTMAAFIAVIMGGPAFAGRFMYRAHPGQTYNV